MKTSVLIEDAVMKEADEKGPTPEERQLVRSVRQRIRPSDDEW